MDAFEKLVLGFEGALEQWERDSLVAAAPSVANHNRVLKQAAQRALAMEDKLVEILVPILEQAGDIAAENFAARATDHMNAAIMAAIDVQRTSTMVCVKPRPEQAAEIFDPDGYPPEDLHCTLVYLGEIDGPLEPIAEALRSVAAEHGPLSGVVGGYGQFPTPNGNVGILLPDVRGLGELRVAVTKALVDAEIDYAREHGFQPHITVDDEAEPDESEIMLALAGMPLDFEALYVVRGDTEIIPVPLVGVLPITAAAPKPFCLPAELRTKMDPIRLAVIENVSKATIEGAGVSFDVSNPFIEKVIERTGQQITHISKTTQHDVMQAIHESYKQGLSIPDTAKAIQTVMKDTAVERATLIARTELAGAVNGASLAGMQVVESAIPDGAFDKVWMTAPGAQYPRHELYADLDGQQVGLSEPFDVGGEALMFPGDPDGDPGEVCNCRCSMSYEDRSGQEVGDQVESVEASAAPCTAHGKSTTSVFEMTAALVASMTAAGPANWSSPAPDEVLNVSCDVPRAQRKAAAAKPAKSKPLAALETPDLKAASKRAQADAAASRKMFKRGLGNFGWQSVNDTFSQGFEQGAIKAKQEVASDLAERLRGNAAWDRYVEETWGKWTGSDRDEQAANKLISQWAQTSADHDPISLALQQAVKDEFGLDPAAWNAIVGRTPASPLRNMARYYEKNGDAYRAFVRAMYENTQAKLKEEGIDKVLLYRAQRTLSTDTVVPAGWSDVGVAFQPMSSFAFELEVTEEFGSTWVGVEVPAERVLSTARTGFGCLGETEYVVLGRSEGAAIDKAVMLKGGGGDWWVPGSERAFWEEASNEVRIGEVARLAVGQDTLLQDAPVGTFLHEWPGYGKTTYKVVEQHPNGKTTVMNTKTGATKTIKSNGDWMVTSDPSMEYVEVIDRAQMELAAAERGYVPGEDIELDHSEVGLIIETDIYPGDLFEVIKVQKNGDVTLRNLRTEDETKLTLEDHPWQEWRVAGFSPEKASVAADKKALEAEKAPKGTGKPAPIKLTAKSAATNIKVGTSTTKFKDMPVGTIVERADGKLWQVVSFTGDKVKIIQVSKSGAAVENTLKTISSSYKPKVVKLP